MRRLISLVLVLCALVIVGFALVRVIPGDPAQIIAAQNSGATEAGVRHALGLDRPIPVQFAKYVDSLAHGDLGDSYLSGEPVRQVISDRFLLSLKIAVFALTVVLLISIPGGMLAAGFMREGRHRHAEVVFAGVSSVLGAIPEYLLATFLAFIFAFWLRLLPIAGAVGWKALILPVLAISIRPAAILMRIVRVEALNVLAVEYIRTARSKRLQPHVIYFRHVLRNVVTAALTLGGLLFAGVIGGAVVVENVFALPGLGTELVNSVLGRDYPVIQGMILVLGAMVVTVNAIVDFCIAAIDPRSAARGV